MFGGINVFFVAASVILGIWLMVLILFIIRAIYNRTLNYETFIDTAVIIRKEWEDGLFEPTFFVYVYYGGEEYCIESETLYQEAKEGELVVVCIHVGYNRRDKKCVVYLTDG